MAARLLHELTADEVERHGGFQIGNFGTGGRTYHHYSRGGRSSSSFCVRLFLIIAALGISWFWWSTETSYKHVHSCADYASQHAKTIEPPLTTQTVSKNLASPSSLVHIAARRPVLTSDIATDPFFGLTGGETTVELRRYTEYCQWHELMHTSQVVVGRDPNCEQQEEHGDCNIYDTRISYSYYKGWSPSLISSSVFDNPFAYQNPSRDPCPTASFLSSNVALDVDVHNPSTVLYISAARAAEFLNSWKPILIPMGTSRTVEDPLSQHGFIAETEKFFYSRAEPSSWLKSAAGAAVNLAVDGVLGTSLFSTCNVGDIRVSFQRRGWEEGVGFSVVGAVSGQEIVPFAIESGDCWLGMEGGSDLDLTSVLEAIEYHETKWLWFYRVGCLVLLLLLGAIWSYHGSGVPNSSEQASHNE